MSFMMAFGLSSVMLCLGILLRAKVVLFRKMLVPASVIGGIIGILFMNIMEGAGIDIGTDSNMFTDIVNNLFTISFISISLTGTPKDTSNTAKEVMKGALGLGMVWCLLYALTPVIATLIIGLVGSRVEMDAIYGTLIQFAFCQDQDNQQPTVRYLSSMGGTMHQWSP